ncbi:MAG: 3-dehydroquinate synthase [Firmicutes bacterium]|nr:3-dehydroquinate synthase [Bacillota bacterium]
MEILEVNTGTVKYPIYINDSFDELKNAFEKANLSGKKAFIIDDTNTHRLFYDKVKNAVGDIFASLGVYTFEAGEKSKNLDTIRNFYEGFLKDKLDRRSVIIALGGGVVGDMAGFAAATFMRGIKFVQIPTTLLSQVDSSVGGKVGVDFMGNKNMIGAFYQPEFVYINSKTLGTLNEREFSSGMGEVIKYGYIIDSEYLEMLEENKEKIKALEKEAIHKVIYGACKAKAYVVSKDEKESGLREILNFGHTFGHAVEALSGYELSHGGCVALGMISGVYLSAERGMIDKGEVTRLKKINEFFGLENSVSGFDVDKVCEQMKFDKKNKDGKINIILLEKTGKAYTEKNAGEDEIKDALRKICL